MCVCVCVIMCVFIFVCVCLCVYASKRACMHACNHAFKRFVCMRACICMCVKFKGRCSKIGTFYVAVFDQRFKRAQRCINNVSN